MGRGGNSTTLNSSNLSFESEIVDQKPFYERWYSIQHLLQSNPQLADRFGFISVEAAPQYFPHDEDWKYRAQVVLQAETHLGTPFKIGYGDTPQQAAQAALSSGLQSEVTANDIGRIFERPSLIGLSPTRSESDWKKVLYRPNSKKDLDIILWRDRYNSPDAFYSRAVFHRYKEVVQPTQKDTVYLHTDFEVINREETEHGTSRIYSFSYHGLVDGNIKPSEGYLEKVLAAFDYQRGQEVFIVAKRTSTGDTYNYSGGHQEPLFAFDNYKAALEYGGYQLTQLPNSTFDNAELILIHQDGLVEELSLDEMLAV